MPTRRRLRGCVLPWAVSLLSVLGTACGTEDARNVPPLRPERPGVPTEEELTTYLEWYRDVKLLTNRNRAETDALMERLSARHPPFPDARTIAAAPEWRELQQRLASETQAHLNRKPTGLTASALAATLAGVGRMVIHPRAMVYEPGRDESALSAARAKYGDEFVDWVLAHEQVIVATLGQ